MSAVTSSAPIVPRSAARGARRITRPLWALALIAAGFGGGRAVEDALRSPGDAIRIELSAAAAELASPFDPAPTEHTIQAIRRHFHGHGTTLDTTLWPQVSVTLQHLDRPTCVDARRVARRIEGLVVVELANYRSTAECGDDNAMTWWIAP